MQTSSKRNYKRPAVLPLPQLDMSLAELTDRGSRRIAIHGFSHANNMEMCVFQYRNLFAWRLKSGLGSFVVDPRPGEKK